MLLDLWLPPVALVAVHWSSDSTKAGSLLAATQQLIKQRDCTTVVHAASVGSGGRQHYLGITCVVHVCTALFWHIMATISTNGCTGCCYYQFASLAAVYKC